MENKKVETNEQFNDKIHKIGITTAIIVGTIFICVPLGITFIFNIDLDWGKVITVAAPISIIFGVTGLCEKLSMSPIIGPGAVYLASSTGNVQNMKLPAALNAMRIVECEEGSDKGRVVSILAVAASSFVTTAIVFAGMLFLAPIAAPLLSNPAIKPAFDNMFPALLGPMVLPAVMKNYKAASVPFAIAIFFALILGAKYSTLQSIVMVVVIIISIAIFKVIMGKKKGPANIEKADDASSIL